MTNVMMYGVHKALHAERQRQNKNHNLCTVIGKVVRQRRSRNTVGSSTRMQSEQPNPYPNCNCSTGCLDRDQLLAGKLVLHQCRSDSGISGWAFALPEYIPLLRIRLL